MSISLVESRILLNISRGITAWSTLITASLLVLITVLDHITGPYLNLSIAYFLPIIYAAWAFRRFGAIVTALIAEIPTYTEQIALVSLGEQSIVGAASTVVVRLLIYLFVAEVTTRLIDGREEARSAVVRTEALANELQAAYTRLDEDARAGGLLQSNILAFIPPSVPGCEVGVKMISAHPVGGDFADAAILNGRIYACIGDISGKGTPAALFSMLLKHLLDSAHRRGLRAPGVVGAINDELCQALPPDRFVTFFYVEIDPASGRIEYVNAGHLEGIAYRHSSGTIELIGPNCSLLGCTQTATEVQISVLLLQPGDALVLYTDGATESKRPDGSRLDDEFIIGVVEDCGKLGAQEMADTIVRRVEDETDQRWRDDLTVLCIKATEHSNNKS